MSTYTKWGVLGFLWLANPIYFTGCFGEKYEFTFDQSDMLALLDEVNEETWIYEVDGKDFEIRFNLEQEGAETASLNIGEILASAHACESRSFVAEAGACITNTDMPVEGVVTIIDAETQEVIQEDLSLSGSMYVYGYDLDNVSLDLYHDGGSFYFGEIPEQEELTLQLDSAEW